MASIIERIGRNTLLCVALTLASPVTTAWAQSAPIKIVIGTAAGGSLDILGRLIAEKLRVYLNTTVIVDNRPGAAGRIAVEAVIASPPDGRTLLLTPSANVVAQPISDPNIKYNVFRDLTPVSHVAAYDMVFAAQASKATSLKAYVAAARSNPAMAQYGIPSIGSLLHFLGELFGKAAGIELTPVPFRGSNPMLQGVIAGDVPAGFFVLSDALEPHRSGQITALAVSGEQRSSHLPDVPTFKEEGYNIAGTAWFAFFAAPGTPIERRTELSREIVRALRDPDVASTLKERGLDLTGTTPEELARIHQADYEKWTPIIKASGFSLSR